MPVSALILETPRLRVRPNTADDLPFLVEMLGDAEVMRFWPRPYTPEEAKEWIAKQDQRQREHGYAYWMAELRETGERVGQLGVLSLVVSGRPEVSLGWIIHHPFWRRGLATEGARGCLDWALAHTDAPRITALVRPENEPSQGVARKLDFKLGERVQHSGLAHDVWFQVR